MDNLLMSLLIRQIPGIRLPEKLFLLEVFTDVQAFLSLGCSDCGTVLGRRINPAAWNPREWYRKALEEVVLLEEKNIQALTFWDAGYPPQLREIYDPPLVLYYRGTLPDYDRPLLGIVGTRYPGPEGRKTAFRFGLELGREGLAAVSGLAKGIDLAAHQGNLAGGGKTVAVLAGGLERIYPPGSVKTSREMIARGGCLFSEYPPGTPPEKFHFPARNRIISGLSRGVVVIEAPEKSGALITADFALEQGRDLYIHSLCMKSSCGEGGKQLILQGIAVVRNPEEILADWWGKNVFYDNNEYPGLKTNVSNQDKYLWRV